MGEPQKRTIDERLDAMSVNMEILMGMMHDFLAAHEQNEIRYKLLASVVITRTTVGLA